MVVPSKRESAGDSSSSSGKRLCADVPLLLRGRFGDASEKIKAFSHELDYLEALARLEAAVPAHVVSNCDSEDGKVLLEELAKEIGAYMNKFGDRQDILLKSLQVLHGMLESSSVPENEDDEKPMRVRSAVLNYCGAAICPCCRQHANLRKECYKVLCSLKSPTDFDWNVNVLNLCTNENDEVDIFFPDSGGFVTLESALELCLVLTPLVNMVHYLYRPSNRRSLFIETTERLAERRDVLVQQLTDLKQEYEETKRRMRAANDAFEASRGRMALVDAETDRTQLEAEQRRMTQLQREIVILNQRMKEWDRSVDQLSQ